MDIKNVQKKLFLSKAIHIAFKKSKLSSFFFVNHPLFALVGSTLNRPDKILKNNFINF